MIHLFLCMDHNNNSTWNFCSWIQTSDNNFTRNHFLSPTLYWKPIEQMNALFTVCINSYKNRTFLLYILPTQLWMNKPFYGSMSIFVCMGMLEFLRVIMIFYCFYTILMKLLQHLCIEKNSAYHRNIFGY